MNPTRLRLCALGALIAGLVAVMVYGPAIGLSLMFAAAMPLGNLQRGYAFGAVDVPSGLKLDKILRTGLVALKRRLLPVLSMSTVFRDQVLEGTDIVRVPFIPLETAASQDFDDEVGYGDLADGGMESRSVTVNKRKFQSLTWSSKEFRRQPAIDFAGIMEQKVNKLADDVLTDIFSVVTAATYGASPLSAIAVSAFDSDDLADLAGAATIAKWPKAGRAVLLDTLVHTNLLKDSSVKAVMNYGNDASIKDGTVNRCNGFDIFEHPSLPDNGEKLIGVALMKSAILAAFSPIEPDPEVRKNMSDYRIVSDPATGLSLEYRVWGDPNSDKAKRVIEVNYGYAVGDAGQLLRIVKP